jgi:peptidoglycan hydrolase-like protein with peptidoglycan-binding domain
MRRKTILLILALSLLAAATPANDRTRKLDVREVETLLSGLGYWITSVDDKSDPSTYHAIMAFQKVERLKRTGSLSRADMESLRFAQRPAARHSTGHLHVEIDITRQVLFVVDAGGSVARILPVSTGNEERYFDQGRWQVAHTPRGRFKVERKINGVRKSSLGSLDYPNYFHQGVAIHGSLLIPPKPASHGCVRIPRFADREFFALIPLGTEVFVYD